MLCNVGFLAIRLYVPKRAHIDYFAIAYRSRGLPQLFDWPRLQSLVLKLECKIRDIADAVLILDDFSPSTLKDVMVEFWSESIRNVNSTLSFEANSRPLQELEQSLLRFLRPRLVCLVDRLRDGRTSFWIQNVGQYFPALLRGGAFTIAPRIGEYHFYSSFGVGSKLIAIYD